MPVPVPAPCSGACSRAASCGRSGPAGRVPRPTEQLAHGVADLRRLDAVRQLDGLDHPSELPGKAPVSTVRSARNLSNTSGVASAPLCVVRSAISSSRWPVSRRRSLGVLLESRDPAHLGRPGPPGRGPRSPIGGPPRTTGARTTVAERRARATRAARAKRRARTTRATVAERRTRATRTTVTKRRTRSRTTTGNRRRQSLAGLHARHHGLADGIARRHPEGRHGHGRRRRATTTRRLGHRGHRHRPDRHAARIGTSPPRPVVVVHAATVHALASATACRRSCLSPSRRRLPADPSTGGAVVGAIPSCWRSANFSRSASLKALGHPFSYCLLLCTSRAHFWGPLALTLVLKCGVSRNLTGHALSPLKARAWLRAMAG